MELNQKQNGEFGIIKYNECLKYLFKNSRRDYKVVIV